MQGRNIPKRFWRISSSLLKEKVGPVHNLGVRIYDFKFMIQYNTSYTNSLQL